MPVAHALISIRFCTEFHKFLYGEWRHCWGGCIIGSFSVTFTKTKKNNPYILNVHTIKCLLRNCVLIMFYLKLYGKQAMSIKKLARNTQNAASLQRCTCMTMLMLIFVFSFKKDNRTRGHEVTFENYHCGLDFRKYSVLQKTINEWNKLPIDYIIAISVNIF